MAELGLSQTLGTLLGGGPSQPNIADNVKSGVQAGVQLATAAEQVQKQKIEVANQQEELQKKQMNGLGNRLKTVAFATNPKQQDIMLKQAKAYADSIQVPFDDESFRASLADPDQRIAIQKAVKDVTMGKVPPDEFFNTVSNAPALFQFLQSQVHENAQTKVKHDNEMELQTLKNEGSERAAAASAGMKLDKEVREGTKDLSKQLDKDSLPELASSIESVRNLVGGDLESPEVAKKFDAIAGSKGMLAAARIPWTQIVPLENKLLKGEEKKLYQAVASVRNSVLKARSGGAVTESEAERLMQELGAGGVRSGEQLRNGMILVSRTLESRIANAKAGYSPAVVSTYEKQGGIKSNPSKTQKPAESDVRTKAQGLVGKVVNPKTGKPYTQAEVDERLKAKGL